MNPLIQTYGIEILTALLVVVTGIYAWLTYKISNTMKIQTRELSRPYVVVYPSVEQSSPMILLNIENIGSRPAYNVDFSLNKEFYQFGEQKEEKQLSRFSAFREGIGCLAPGSRLQFYLGVGFDIFSDKKENFLSPLEFIVNIKYKDRTQESYNEDMIVDIKPFKNMAVSKGPYEDDVRKISKSLDEIAKELRMFRKDRSPNTDG